VNNREKKYEVREERDEPKHYDDVNEEDCKSQQSHPPITEKEKK
jgi:hypothetical protein